MFDSFWRILKRFLLGTETASRECGVKSDAPVYNQEKAERAFRHIMKLSQPDKTGASMYRPTYQHAMFIRKVIDSSKLEGQIATCIEWIHRLYRRGFLPIEVYHELIHHAIYREEQIITERVKKDFVCPHVKKRADEIVEEERRKNIRIIKSEVN